MSRAALIVASILMLVAPRAVAADATDPPTTAPPSAASPSAEPSPVVVEPSPATEVQPVPAATAPIAPRPAASASTSTAAVATTTATVLPAPSRLKRERHGLAILGGIGITYAALGGQLRYDIPVRHSLTVSPFFSAGIFGALPGPIGVASALGARHRLVVDLGVAPLSHQQLTLHGSLVTERTVFGPLAGAGYEHMSDGGWIQRVTLEYGYATWGSVTPHSRHVAFIGGAVGWRFW